MAIKRWVNDYSAMQGPCPNGFHVPCREELDEMVSIMESFGFTEDNDYITKLKVPLAGYRNSWKEGIVDVGEGARLVSSTPFEKGVYNISFFGRGPGQYFPDDRCVGWSIRPFSNIPVLPDSTRTTIYQGQGNSGIFHNTTDGIISLSANGKRWITITDKNLGATQVYNNGDTLSESNCGKFYQWGNNYGFPWEGAVTISNNKVDTTGYGPGNYYNNGVYIIPSYPYDRSISQNDNLRGGTTPTLKEQEIKSLRTNPTYSSMQGPCPNGYHVPSIDEITELKDAMEDLGLTTGDNRRVYLKMPFVGEINTSAQSKGMGSRTMLWTVDIGGTTYSGRVMRITATTVVAGPSSRAYGNMIRPFKNESLIPDNTWTVIYQGTGNAGIFHNATEGVISVSSNGTNWITIADKNLGATTVYNDGDTLSNANSGHYYQRGNNYGFNGPDGPVPQTDPAQVDASNYGPGNYYSSSIFITGNNDRSSVQNDNLWGGIYTPIKKVTIWKDGVERQIRPTLACVDFLLVGGGGAGGGNNQIAMAGDSTGGGGAGGVFCVNNYPISNGEYCVVIGSGGNNNPSVNGGDSCFIDYIAVGGGRGGCSGGSGGGAIGSENGGVGCCGVDGQGYGGGNAPYKQGGGGGGAGGIGGDGTSTVYGGAGGLGIISDISGESCCYAGGGGGGGKNGGGDGCYGGGNGGANGNGANATTYGSGGGGAGGNWSSYTGIGGKGCQGIFILRYPVSCGYNISGGCKYECNGYCIHCFTSDGTLCVVC